MKLKATPEERTRHVDVKVPIDCHSGPSPAFQDPRGETSPLRMDPDIPVNLSAIVFLESTGPRPPSRVIKLGNRAHQKLVEQYNDKEYQIDPQGFRPGEKEHKVKKVESVMRRPAVPLLYINLNWDDGDKNSTGAGRSC